MNGNSQSGNDHLMTAVRINLLANAQSKKEYGEPRHIDSNGKVKGHSMES